MNRFKHIRDEWFLAGIVILVSAFLWLAFLLMGVAWPQEDWRQGYRDEHNQDCCAQHDCYQAGVAIEEADDETYWVHIEWIKDRQGAVHPVKQSFLKHRGAVHRSEEQTAYACFRYSAYLHDAAAVRCHEAFFVVTTQCVRCVFVNYGS